MGNLIVRMVRVIKNPRRLFEKLLRLFSKCFSDKVYLSLLYYLRFNRKIDWSQPKSFNEKLNWLKVNDRNPLFTILADKYKVKQFVSKVIGDEYVVPNLGVWDTFSDINFSLLPNQFVLKATHDSSGALIIKDKNNLDFKFINKKYSGLLKKNFYWGGREWPYKNITPQIIADMFLDDNTAGKREISLRDYKFWCFNGVPKYMYCTVKDTDIYENFYDVNFNSVNINHGSPRSKSEFTKPRNYEKMWELAGKLAVASEAKFVRVDFFNVDGRIYFGEFTFYDWGGLRPFLSYQQDRDLGDLIMLD